MQRPSDGDLISLGKKFILQIKKEGKKAFVKKIINKYNVGRSQAYEWVKRIEILLDN